MKRVTLIILLMLAACCGLMAQYTVTKVIGTVKNKTSGEILKTGSKLSDEDILVFSSINDMVRVIVAGKGVYIISPTARPGAQQSEIVEMLRTALHVKFKEGYLSGRSGEDELLPATLETQEIMNTKSLFKEINKYVFDVNAYNSSKGRFFLQIEEPGGSTSIHPLQSVGDTLIIYASDFKTSGKMDPQKAIYKLGFFSKEENSSRSLALIQPYIDSTGEMETIMKEIIEENINSEREKIEQACYSEVYAALGKPSPVVFRNVFNNLMAKVSKKK